MAIKDLGLVKGKSAYEYAVQGGYNGTEDQFYTDLGKTGQGGGGSDTIIDEIIFDVDNFDESINSYVIISRTYTTEEVLNMIKQGKSIEVHITSQLSEGPMTCDFSFTGFDMCSYFMNISGGVTPPPEIPTSFVAWMIIPLGILSEICGPSLQYVIGEVNGEFGDQLSPYNVSPSPANKENKFFTKFLNKKEQEKQ